MVDIKGFEGLYAVTSCGKVWSYRSKKFLEQAIDEDGYRRVTLRKEGVKKSFLVHRLVALAYIPNPNNLETVDHIDNCKNHNCIGNLQWMTRGDNVRKGKSKKIYCEELDRVFDSQRQAADELGLNQSNLSKVCRGVLETTGGFHFSFYKED